MTRWRLIQANINHAAAAQDLLQTMAEKGIDIALMSEPYRVPDHPSILVG